MKAPRPRTALASVAAVAGALGFAFEVGPNRGVAIPLVAVCVGAAAAFVPHLFAQIAARALFWSNLVLGALICILGRSSSLAFGAPLLLGCAAALLVGERRTLAEVEDARRERPAAFAGTLELLMILAIADAQTFGLFAYLDGAGSQAAPYYVAAAAALLVGFVGLYRLALWGVVVNMVACGLLALAVVGGIAHVDRELVLPILLLTTLQLVVPVPMIRALVTKKPSPPLPRRARAVAGSIAVAAVAVLSLAIGAIHALSNG